MVKYVYENDPELLKPFFMVIEDVFTIKGRGTCVAGRIQTGRLCRGEIIEISGQDGEPVQTRCAGLFTPGFVDCLEAGDNAGILLSDINLDQVARGMVVTKVDETSINIE